MNNVGIPVLRTGSPVGQVGDNLARVPKAHEDHGENNEHGCAEEETGDRAVHPSHGTAARIASLFANDGVTCASW